MVRDVYFSIVLLFITFMACFIIVLPKRNGSSTTHSREGVKILDGACLVSVNKRAKLNLLSCLLMLCVLMVISQFLFFRADSILSESPDSVIYKSGNFLLCSSVVCDQTPWRFQQPKSCFSTPVACTEQQSGTGPEGRRDPGGGAYPRTVGTRVSYA